MVWFFGKKKEQPIRHAPKLKKRDHFFSTDVDRLLSGWDTQSNSIDFYLANELTKIRARSRKLSRQNNLGHRYVSLLQNNIVGERGIQVQSQVAMPRGDRLDEKANRVIEESFKRWCERECDYAGQLTFTDFQHAIMSALATDGEAIIRKHVGSGFGKHGFQLELVDPEKLDVTKNERGIRLGVQRDVRGKPVRYYFRESRGYSPAYDSLRKDYEWSEPAENILHLFICESPDQSRGIPWMAAGLEKAKHLEKYTEAAIIRARATASRIATLSSDPDDPYLGDEAGDADDIQFDLSAAGEVWDIGTRQLQQYDADYPTSMYEPFVKQNIRDVASAWGVSYQSLSSDLSDTSFGSARTGIMEEREGYKQKQRWMINNFIKPVYELWLFSAYSAGAFVFDGRRTERVIDDYYHYDCQPKRWEWIDPAKDAKAQETMIAQNLRSRSQVIRDQGGDPESVFMELAKEKELLESLGLAIIAPQSHNSPTAEDESDDEKED